MQATPGIVDRCGPVPASRSARQAPTMQR